MGCVSAHPGPTHVLYHKIPSRPAWPASSATQGPRLIALVQSSWDYGEKLDFWKMLDVCFLGSRNKRDKRLEEYIFMWNIVLNKVRTDQWQDKSTLEGQSNQCPCSPTDFFFKCISASYTPVGRKPHAVMYTATGGVSQVLRSVFQDLW